MATAGRASATESLPVGADCPNCGATLGGPWCQMCGQRAADYHRSFLKLSREALQGLFSYDSRIWLTLRRLAFRPAGLTRDFLQGRRAPQVPPFRMFLVVVVILFFAGGVASRNHPDAMLKTGPGVAVAPGLRIGVPAQGGGDAVTRLWDRSVARAISRPDAFRASIDTWAHRLAILTLPFAALFLSLAFLGRRDLYLFDHLVFAMHSITFQGLVVSAAVLLAQLTGWAYLLLLVIPAHFFVHLRGVYETSVPGTIARMLALLVAGGAALLALGIALVAIGLYEVGGPA